MAVRTFPRTAVQQSVTWAPLSVFAWARKAEDGIATGGTDVGAKIRTAFHTSRPTKIAADNQGGIRMRPGRGPGPGPDGVGSFPEGDGGLGVAVGPLTRTSFVVAGGCTGHAPSRLPRWAADLEYWPRSARRDKHY